MTDEETYLLTDEQVEDGETLVALEKAYRVIAMQRKTIQSYKSLVEEYQQALTSVGNQLRELQKRFK